MLVNGYRCMWVLAMFDLPTDTKKARKDYTLFRKHLLEDGFTMMQYSVYARHCASKENAEVHTQRIKRHLPPDGEVRVTYTLSPTAATPLGVPLTNTVEVSGSVLDPFTRHETVVQAHLVWLPRVIREWVP